MRERKGVGVGRWAHLTRPHPTLGPVSPAALVQVPRHLSFKYSGCSVLPSPSGCPGGICPFLAHSPDLRLREISTLIPRTLGLF